MNENQWRQLVQRAVSGDMTAFELLYRLTERSVYFTCLKLLANEHNAKDVTQDSFMTALEKLGTLEDGAKFPKWINVVAVNKCRAFFVKPPEESLDEHIEQGGELTDDSFIPEDYVTDTEKRRVIMDIIDTELSDVQRQTVLLYYYNGMTAAEIAGVMDCPEGTVMYRLHAARKKLREAVLIYEKEHDDRLHAIVPVPALTRIFRAEAEQLSLPDIPLQLPKAGSVPENTILKKAGGSTVKKALALKIAAGAVAAAVVIGGIAVAVSKSSDDDDSSSRTRKGSSQSSAASVEDSVEENAGSSSPGPDPVSEGEGEVQTQTAPARTTTTEAAPAEPAEEPAKNLVEPEDIIYLPWLTAGALKFDYPSHFEYDINVDYRKLEYAKNEFVQGFVHNTKGHAVFAFDCKIGDADRFLYMWYLDVDEDTPKAATNEEAYTRSEPLLLAEIKTEYGTLEDECEISIDSKETIHLDAVPVYSNIRSEYDYDFIKGTVTVHAEDGDHLVHFSGAFGALEEAIRASTTVNNIPLMLLTFAETEDEYTLQYLDTVILNAMENMGRS